MRDKLRRMQGGQGPDPERRGRSPTRKFLAYDRSRESGGQMPPFPPANLAARPTSSA